MALTTGFQLPFGIQPLNPVPADSWSGPYEGSTEAAAITAANASIPSGVRFKSMEVRLIIDGKSAKYWYKDGVSNSNLVEFAQLPDVGSFTNSVSAPMISGTFFGDGAGLTGLYAAVKQVNTTSLSSYSFESADINNIVTINNGTNDTIFIIEQNFQTTTKIGAQIVLVQLGTGTITVSSTIDPNPIISSYGRYKLVGQNSSAALIKISNNSWFLGGDIAV